MADAVIIIFWLVCLIRGVFRGPVNEVFSIAGALAGLVVAGWFYSPLAGLIPDTIGSAPLRSTASFLLLFIGTYLSLSVSGIIAAYLMHLHRVGWLSRAFGAGLGFIKGVLVVAVLLVPLVAFLPQKAARLGRSAIIPFENQLAVKVASVTPSALHQRFSLNIDADKPIRKKGRTRFKDTP